MDEEKIIKDLPYNKPVSSLEDKNVTYIKPVPEPRKTYAFRRESMHDSCCKLACWAAVIILICAVLGVLFYYKMDYKRTITVRPRLVYNIDINQNPAELLY